jgi:bidirectional [NiFe] hydrogenase diaphorase subunit
MLSYVTVTIDGATQHVPEGIPVLEAALDYGVCIPHLCHLPGLEATGACRLCIVELVEGNRAKVTTSCTLNTREGLVVRTNTERIRHLRRNIAELLVAQAPDSRAIQDIAVRCGVTNVRYPFRRDDCVQCGRCVRVCAGILGANAIGFVGRGKDRHVDHAFHRRPDGCKKSLGCAYCLEVCPMVITPCGGSMKPGQEHLCGQCESQLSMERDLVGICVKCELGKGFHCLRQAP